MNTRGSIWGSMPPVTKNLIIINFIVYLAMFVLPGRIGTRLEDLGGLHYFTSDLFNPVQLVTYMFMHSTSNLAHIFFNMFSLWMFGMTLERTLGGARFLFYYLSCGIGAGLVQELAWALTWENSLISMVLPQFANANGLDYPEAKELLREGIAQNMPFVSAVAKQYVNMMVTIGASGAVYGILLAFGMLYPNAPLFLFFIPVPIKAKWMVLGMGAIEVLMGISEATSLSDGVAHFAHLGGMIFGILMIMYWKRTGTFNGNGGYGGGF